MLLTRRAHDPSVVSMIPTTEGGYALDSGRCRASREAYAGCMSDCFEEESERRRTGARWIERSTSGADRPILARAERKPRGAVTEREKQAHLGRLVYCRVRWPPRARLGDVRNARGNLARHAR